MSLANRPPYQKMAKISCILRVSVMRASVSARVGVCVRSAADPKVINSANTFVLTQSRGEVFLCVYPTSHYLLCIDCLSREEQHDNTWNEIFFPLSHLVTENPVRLPQRNICID